MKKNIVKLIMGVSLSVLLSICYSTCCENEIIVSDSAVNTIFTIIGVFFSVGMSLVIANPQAYIINETIKKNVIHVLKTVKSTYMILFLFVSILYILIPNNDAEITIKIFTINARDIFVAICLYTLLKFVINFNDMYNLFQSVKDEIDKNLTD